MIINWGNFKKIKRVGDEIRLVEEEDDDEKKLKRLFGETVTFGTEGLNYTFS